MAADRPLSERGFVEVKMGRSKFPGKPSKIGNRKRVNLSSCALPEDNDSSKAAKNIYLGLSVFNETFGDNEMVAPPPFHGFSLSEVEEALAEARLQQNEAELEHKKQGVPVNLWDSFQKELFSIRCCSGYDNTKVNQVNQVKLSFDGGGSEVKKDCGEDSAEPAEGNEQQPSKAVELKNSLQKGNKPVKICTEIKDTLNSSPKKESKIVKLHNPILMLTKLTRSSSLNKSLQSQAAKRLLEKAKMSNTLESSKGCSTEKKFILPNYSIHSSRVIKPNKKFFEESTNKRKLLRSRTVCGVSVSKRPKVLDKVEEPEAEEIEKKEIEEAKNEVQSKKVENNLNESKVPDCVKGSSQLSSGSGKVILREARLQLESSNSSLLGGPFSSPSASSLSPNSQLNINSAQSVTAPGGVLCGVCGVVKLYGSVHLAKKFGIYGCEYCRNFITKIIKSLSFENKLNLQCVKGKGLCGIVPIVNSQNLNAGMCSKTDKCEACWLKLCLKNFKMSVKLKQKLLKLLPVNMQFGVGLELSPILSNDINSRFLMGNNIKDFKWLKENCSSSSQIKFTLNDKQPNWPNPADSNGVSEKSLRKRNRSGSEKFASLNGKAKTETDEKNRQSVVLKGPRVKHVCRSASIVLGQPLATFPNETNPTKKNANDPGENCKNCDNAVTTNNAIETQGAVEKTSGEDSTSEVKEEKKAQNSRGAASSKAVQPGVGTKSKKKANVKTENPVSMDFWEAYDPDEVCETGFGLIGSDSFSVRALCFLCGSSGQEKLIHCASCCEPYHEFCVNEGQLKLQDGSWKYDWVCPRCTVCATCGKTSGQQLKCIKCDNSYHTDCVDRVGGRLLYSPDRPWVCSICLRCKSCNGIDVSVFVGNLPLCKSCFVLRQKGNYCPLCQRCYEDDDYDSKMMECGQCKCWVHAKCEGLSDEKYQVLSFLPESVEYVCRMCCVMPPAPWWVAVEAELKSGYLGVLKALSKNRKVCTMLKWSPRKQCTCKQVGTVSRNADLEDSKPGKPANDCSKSESNSGPCKEESKSAQESCGEKGNEEKYQPGVIQERKTSIEVISHPTESLKLTLKIMKGSETDGKEKSESFPVVEETAQVKQVVKDGTLRVKKCLSNDENSEDSSASTFDSPEEGQVSAHAFLKGNDPSELSDKRLLSSPLNPPSDSGIGSTDDELKASCLTDEESCKLEDQQSNANRGVDAKSQCDSSLSFVEERRECFCFLEVDSYNSRSKPFSPNLMSIKKKVTTCEYTSLHQFHQDMQGMIATTQSTELMDLYHQTIKEIFPWFDPKYSRVQSNSQKVSGTTSVESTPVKSTPTKSALLEECRVPVEKLSNQCLDYFYSDHVVEDDRVCLMCKTVGDGPPGGTGRLLYCGQNEWVHCNCALWSGEVFEEIDGSLQNVHSAISRGRSIRCPECNLKGASIGCCARNCQETYHFRCAREVGCVFMDDKSVYCPAHSKESVGKAIQNEKEFEIRRPVYVELDKRKMKTVDSSQIHFAVGALHVNNLGKFLLRFSDRSETIIPEQFECTRLFWSCFEPWRIVRYHFSVRLQDVDEGEGIDYGVNLTIDHSVEPEIVELKLKQLQYFQANNALLDIGDKLEEIMREKQKSSEEKPAEGSSKRKPEEGTKTNVRKRTKKDQKVVKRVLDQFDENCLSDNQNTTGLLPPDIEEAIFKDLPNDILDGISMQDIFMDIKNDSYDGNAKDGIAEDGDGDDSSETLSARPRRTDFHADTATQLDFSWIDASEYRQEFSEETFSKSQARDLKKVKHETVGGQHVKKGGTLRTYQKSCGLNWNCKTEGQTNNKWKKSPKCHVTVNLVETQDRGNMLQELKFTDGLVSVTTGTIDPVKDLKGCMEEKCSMQQEEGKENKCLAWHTRLQPRLLQVDGGVDSSSSGSEAGESPQRVIDENINSKIVPMPQSSPFLDSLDYPLGGSRSGSFAPAGDNYCGFTGGYSGSEGQAQGSRPLMSSLPQLDGAADLCSDGSDSDEFFVMESLQRKRPRHESAMRRTLRRVNFKIKQCDGGVDSESDENESKLCAMDELPIPFEPSKTDEKPVKCKRCHCTYRTQLSYQRHLEMCRSDFILSSSEGEMSEEESQKSQSDSESLSPTRKTERSPVNEPVKPNAVVEESANASPCTSAPSNAALKPDDSGKAEVNAEKTAKMSYESKKPVQNTKVVPVVNNVPQVQQIMVQQPNATPTLIVQDVPAPNVVQPATYTDVGPTIGYVNTVEAQNPFVKPQLYATPNGIISGNFQFPPAPEPQIVGGLCLNPPTTPGNIPGFIIQQPHPSGPVISQPGPVLMPNDQMILATQGLYDVIQNPGTGEVFLTNRSQPLYYNMDTFVNNTVMPTNQFVPNVLSTGYSQASTQVYQDVDQVVNVPQNYILLAPNPPPAEKILPPDALICVQAPTTLIPNQPSQALIPNQPSQALIPNQPSQGLIPSQPSQALIPSQPPQALIPSQPTIQIRGQTIYNASFQPPRISAEHKIISAPLNPIRCVQSVQIRRVGPPIVVNKVPSAGAQLINPPPTQAVRPPLAESLRKPEVKVKPVSTPGTNQVKNPPAAKPAPAKTGRRASEKPAPKPKTQAQQRARTLLVDYINNFRSDTCDSLKECSDAKPKTDFCCQSDIEPAKSQNLSIVPVSSSAAVPAPVDGSFKPAAATDSKLSNDLYGISSGSKIIVENAGKSPEKPSGSLPPVIPLLISTPEKYILQLTPLELKTKVCKSTSTDFVKTSPPNKATASLDKKPEPEVVENKVSEKVEKAETTVSGSTAKVLTNISNSCSFERDLNSSASLPSLDGSPPPPCQVEQQVQPKPAFDPSPNAGKQAGETLPLQNSFQSLNKAISMSPAKTKTPPSEEKSKLKKKVVPSDQNSVVEKFAAENPKESKVEKTSKKANIKRSLFEKKCEEKGPRLIFDVISDDGFKSSSTSMVELWANICNSVQEMRAVLRIPPLPVSRKGHEILGMQNHGLQHCLEQLKGVEHCVNYKCRYFIREPKKEDDEETFIEKENLSGSARTEKFSSRKEYDMFAWLASRHRQLPKLTESAEETLSSIRRANSLPMAMRYRNLKETAKLYVGVYRSKIHGRGLFCLREIEAGEMVIEYAGEVIRSNLTDKREKYYTEKGIGCYMFRIDDHFVVDATMKGNAARFINHSCEPNCYSRVIDILGKKHIVIFALRRINVMEELTYDYKFPFEDEKISCHCLSKKCRKYLN